MAKLIRGRLDGVYGMTTFTADELHQQAKDLSLDARLASWGPGWARDDERWLKRWSEKIRHLAEQKEKARLQKKDEKRKHPRRGVREATV